MDPNYSIISPDKLYSLTSDIYVISGTPFLYLKKHYTIVIGDLHLGQESSLFGKDNNQISKSCKTLTDELLRVMNIVEVQNIICNGDIKHHTNSIKIQELEELKYFTTKLLENNVELTFIKGNHDELIEFVFPFVDIDRINLVDLLLIDNILLTHGHEKVDDNIDFSCIILSHEHPAYTFYGHNRAKVKLPAFVQMRAGNRIVIILPAANSISLGTNFPPKSKDSFLSPFLQKHGELQTMELFPFDPKFGILEIPPVSTWFRD